MQVAQQQPTLPPVAMILTWASSPLCTITTRGCFMPNLFTFTTSKNWAAIVTAPPTGCDNAEQPTQHSH